MIRARREEDLDRLCAVLETLTHPAGFPPRTDFGEWLTEHDAEQSWVFDMAPVRVAPTRNVVGHVQVYRPTKEAVATYLVEHTRKPAGDLLAIGKLFVRPDTHESGIGRYLLKTCVDYIRGQGRLAVLDVQQNWFPFEGFFERHGFAPIPSDDPGAAPMVYRR
jgi:GNAT superfamily N-acetyltransferase